MTIKGVASNVDAIPFTIGCDAFYTSQDGRLHESTWYPLLGNVPKSNSKERQRTALSVLQVLKNLSSAAQAYSGLQTNLEEQCLPRPFWRLCQPDQGMDLAPFWAKGLGVETCIATERPSNCIKWLNWSYSSLDSCGQDNGCHRIIAD